MLYKKGDTIKFRNGKVAIILSDGLSQLEFKRLYLDEIVSWYYTVGDCVDERVVSHFIFRYDDHGYKNRPVYYTVLVGDNKGWTTDKCLIRAQERARNV